MISDRDLSERLSILAKKIEDIINELGDAPDLLDVAQELHVLSNEKYTPGNINWADIKNLPKPAPKKFPF